MNTERFTLYRSCENYFDWLKSLIPFLLLLLISCSNNVEERLSDEEFELIFEEGASFYRSENFEAAYSIWMPLAEQGYAEAQYHLGIMIVSGSIGNEDLDSGVHWIRRATEENHTGALYSMGELHSLDLRGRSNYLGNKDYETALSYFQRAVGQGSFASMLSLGWVYEHGQGVSQNDVTAYMWYFLAINEDDLARNRSEMLAERMTASQIDMAIEFAEQCASSEYQRCQFE